MLVSEPAFIPGDEIKVSATTYVAWKKCPDSANVRLQGIFGPDSRHSFVGSLAHLVFSRHLTKGPIAPDDFENVCKQEIGGSSLNHKMGGLELKPSTLRGVIEEVRGLYERFVRFPGEGFESSEKTLDHRWDDVQLVGKIDAVFRADLGGHKLVDWKTGEIGDAEDQLLFYAFLWAVVEEELPAQVEAVSVKTGERFHTVPGSDDVNRVAAEVGELVNQIRRAWETDTGLARHGGPWCGYCPVLEDCPEGKATTALLG